MKAAMNRLRLRKRQSIIPRILVLVLMAALSANTLLAAVGTGAGCDGRCCCCMHSTTGPTLSISANRFDGCCGPADATACHVSTGQLPAAIPALVQATHHLPLNPGHLLTASTTAAAVFQPAAPIPPWVDIGPANPSFPIYLRTSRIIC